MHDAFIAGEACNYAAGVDRLLADPNKLRTPLGSNQLWQLGLLEMWLQRHGIG